MILNKNTTLQRLDGFGRIYIPKKIQNILNLEYDSVVTLEFNEQENAIIVRKSGNKLSNLLSVLPNLNMEIVNPCELDTNWYNEVGCPNTSISCAECKTIFWEKYCGK